MPQVCIKERTDFIPGSSLMTQPITGQHDEPGTLPRTHTHIDCLWKPTLDFAAWHGKATSVNVQTRANVS